MTGRVAYRPATTLTPIDLDLRANEGPETRELPSLTEDDVRLYPRTAELEDQIAARWGRAPNEVLVTAGADDALSRIGRAFLWAGTNAVIPVPAFTMTKRSVEMADAEIRPVAWDGPFSAEAVQQAVDDNTRVIFLTSPNNPTGRVIPTAALLQVARANPDVLTVVDLAYVDFAGSDPTRELAREPSILVLRTLSKGPGLAGLRVGFVLGAEDLVESVRAAGEPFAVAGPSLRLAAVLMDRDRSAYRGQVIRERDSLTALFRELGYEVAPSEANFLFVQMAEPSWFAEALAGLGIGVRVFPALGAVRITCPGSEAGLTRLTEAVRTVLAPEALLLDMDGVLVDVSRSYRRAIVLTAATFGVELTAEDVAEAKAEGDANNDWKLTVRMLQRRGVDATLEEVTRRFEAAYQAGLWREETQLTSGALFGSSLPIAVVTGRPREDAERAMAMFGWSLPLICMEDAPAKPSPDPVKLALRLLGVQRAWMVGDTPDDVIAARAAGVLPVGCLAPGESSDEALRRAGAGWVVSQVDDLGVYL